ncbi:MAG: 50S ribosomal protein L40e [Candidatus Woesearchaeota archaeon]|jgi:ribosomal protein L40E|nr:50S ribosomal protein L40e [Candidatus Woesearchaeota archaeon]
MAKFPEAHKRLFVGKYACLKCKTVTKAKPLLVAAGKIKCRKCGYFNIRPLRKR